MDMGLYTGIEDQDLRDAMAFVAGKTIRQIKDELAAADVSMRQRLFARSLGLSRPTTEDETCKLDSYCPW